MHARMHTHTQYSVFSTSHINPHTLYKHSLNFNIGLCFSDENVCVCVTYRRAHTLCAGSSENTYILSLSLMDEEMLTQTNKHKLHPRTPHYLCMLFLELQLSVARTDVSSSSAPPRPHPPPILSFSLPAQALPDCLLVFPGGSQLPFPGWEVGGGSTAYDTYFPPLKAEGQRWFLLSTGPTGSTSALQTTPLA